MEISEDCSFPNFSVGEFELLALDFHISWVMPGWSVDFGYVLYEMAEFKFGACLGSQNHWCGSDLGN